MAAMLLDTANGSSTSQNWAGYVVQSSATGHALSAVAADWVVPTAVVAGSSDTYSAFWVGLDGYGSSTVEQIGISADVIGGVPAYYAWMEMYPAASQEIVYRQRHTAITPAPVRPGDQITAAVSYLSVSGEYALSISNLTQNWTFSTNQLAQAGTTPTRSSAEWIAEAPTDASTGKILPLTNFGSVTFTNASLTFDGGSTGSIGSFANTQLSLVPQAPPAGPGGLRWPSVPTARAFRWSCRSRRRLGCWAWRGWGC